ncbi:MAG: tRNA dihydrouridine(20/20a) synthase DusA [Alphaproteobacteria bacterium]
MIASPAPTPDRRLSVAPMMGWTDRHARYFLRLIAPRALLYTEMVPSGAIVYGDAARFLGHDPIEHPLALQVGGGDPAELGECARTARGFGFAEINLNVGCPSERVQRGTFGACLMKEPDLVAACVAAMGAASDVPVTVKCRIGVDELDSEAALHDFVGRVAEAGCETFILHARKAWLKGLSPKENREVPPLDHDRVYRLKSAFPNLEIIINGGIESADAAAGHLAHVDGVMIGRAAYRNPWLLTEMEPRLLGPGPGPADRATVIESVIRYVEAQAARRVPLISITRHILGLYKGLPGAARWRRYLSENVPLPGANADVLRRAAVLVEDRDARTAA